MKALMFGFKDGDLCLIENKDHKTFYLSINSLKGLNMDSNANVFYFEKHKKQLQFFEKIEKTYTLHEVVEFLLSSPNNAYSVHRTYDLPRYANRSFIGIAICYYGQKVFHLDDSSASEWFIIENPHKENKESAIIALVRDVLRKYNLPSFSK